MVLEAPGSYGAPKGSEEAYGIKYLAVVKVTTDAGITGYADIETQPHVARAIVEAPSGDAVPGFQGLKHVLIGEDPFEVERLWQKMYMASVYYGRRGAAIQVISGIDICAVGRADVNRGQAERSGRVCVIARSATASRSSNLVFRFTMLASGRLIPRGAGG